MHDLNRVFWQESAAKYPRYFNDPSTVIEFGSYYVNGSIREYFNCATHVGVDWRPGRYVDVVSLAHEVPFPPPLFDTVASASLLEHDPYWELTLAKMLAVMKPDGMLVITWGAAMNWPHEHHSAPDGEFHALQAGHVLRFMEQAGVYIHDFRYERSVSYKRPPEQLAKWNTGLGECALVVFKSPEFAVGESFRDPLMNADRID